MPTRRKFLQHTIDLAAATCAGTHTAFTLAGDKPRLFEYSLAQWSLHRSFRSGKYKAVEFAKIARGNNLASAKETKSARRKGLS